MTNTTINLQTEYLEEQRQASRGEELDLQEIGNTLKRHWRVVAGVTGSMLVISGLTAITRKPVWEAQFQIVLEVNNPSQGGAAASIINSSPVLARLARLRGGGTAKLETEVKILESPSVLMPVYNYVKNQKQLKGEDTTSFKFADWASQVEVELEKGTSVLDISYRDTQKDIVLPVINLISKTYQDYSGRDRTRGITQSIIYLSDQVATLRKQSEASMKAAQSFALKYGLPLGNTPSAIAINNATRTISMESERTKAQNKVFALQQQLEGAKAAGSQSVYVAPQLEANAELYGELQKLQGILEERSALLKPNDQSILTLKRQIRSKAAYINQQTIGLLQGQLNTAQAQLKSLTRPNDVILKHRELMRKSMRDEKTLTELEAQLQMMQLEKSRQTDPWELISKPTLLDHPVAPNKKRMVALGMLGGLVLGSVGALIVDKRRGFIFSKNRLQQLLPCPLLKNWNSSEPSSWQEAARLLAVGPLEGAEGRNIALIPVGKVPDQNIQQFKNELLKAIPNGSVTITNDLLTARESVYQLLVASPGSATQLQIEHLKMRLNLQGTPLAGWIFLDS